jgi:cytochrome c oxidase subunit 2
VARRRWGSGARLGAALLGLALLLPALGCTLHQFPQTTLDPQSDYASLIQRLLVNLVFWVVLIFVVVEGVLIVTVLRFRARPGAPQPRAVHGNTVLEIAWTVAPALILVAIAIPTVTTIFRTQAPAPARSLAVKVVAHQWWWEFQYPQRGVVTANELHVPVGRPVELTLESADVIHSFWVPAIGGKRDVVPAHVNRLWFTPRTLGTYPGQCAEMCGISHANMRMKLVVERPADFERWVARQLGPAAEPDSLSAAGRGRRAFAEVGCAACHTIRGLSPGVIGPDLTHVASRTSIAGAILPNTPEALTRWLEDPPARKPGTLMPKLGLEPGQVADLVAYLRSLE